MANKVTTEDILRINELYYKHKTYAEVARQTGFAPSTVKKYVKPNWKPIDKEKVIHFDMALLPDFVSETATLFQGIQNYGLFCELTDFEKEEMKELWGELTI